MSCLLLLIAQFRRRRSDHDFSGELAQRRITSPFASPYTLRLSRFLGPTSHRQIPHRRPDCTPRGESERATLGHEAVPHERRHHHPPRRRLRRSLHRHLRHDHATLREGIARLSARARMRCSSGLWLQFALEPLLRLRAQAPPPPPDFPRVRRRHISPLFPSLSLSSHLRHTSLSRRADLASSFSAEAPEPVSFLLSQTG